jgi:hypothetical protein
MFRGTLERRFLQVAVAVVGLMPVATGALGAIRPELLFDGPAHALGHSAYLSGLLPGLGLANWSLIPSIGHQSQIFGPLTGLVVVGGLARRPSRRSGWAPWPAGRACAGLGIGHNAGPLAVAAPRLFTFGSRTPIFDSSSIQKALTWH